MNPHRVIITVLCFILCGYTFAQAQDIDTELANLTERLAGKIQAKDIKKVAVIDFTDLQGGSSELGKYIAEQLTVDFVMTNRVFTVLDRANLKRILAEHKLTATGLIDPDNAKKIGMFAGVDALIMGTIIPKGDKINLTAKMITTETAEIVGADKAGFKPDDTVKQLLAKPATESNVGGNAVGTDSEATKVTKKFGNLSVEVQSLQVVNGGRQYVLNLGLSNTSAKKSIWVAFSGSTMSTSRHGIISDSNGFEFLMDTTGSSGIASSTVVKDIQFYASSTPAAPDHLNQATEIQPGDSVIATAKFFSQQGRLATAGQCTVQLEILVSNDFNDNGGSCTTKNLSAKISAE